MTAAFTWNPWLPNDIFHHSSDKEFTDFYWEQCGESRIRLWSAWLAVFPLSETETSSYGLYLHQGWMGSFFKSGHYCCKEILMTSDRTFWLPGVHILIASLALINHWEVCHHIQLIFKWPANGRLENPHLTIFNVTKKLMDKDRAETEDTANQWVLPTQFITQYQSPFSPSNASCSPHFHPPIFLAEG